MPSRSAKPQVAAVPVAEVPQSNVLPAERWSRRHLAAVERLLHPTRPEKPNDVKLRAEALGPWADLHEQKRSLTPVVRFAEQARLRLVGEAPADYTKPLPTSDVYKTRYFEISYTRAPGENQVIDPDLDTPVDVRLASGRLLGRVPGPIGTPNYVKMLGLWLEYALRRYKQLGYRSPFMLGQERIPVRIQGSNSYSSTLYNSITMSVGMGNRETQYNELSEGLGVTPGHELFHLVQARYQSAPTTNENMSNFWEGTARWSESLLNPRYPRYVQEVREYLLEGGSSDNCFTGRVPYRSSLFYRYMSEQLQRQAGSQANVVARLWEAIGRANATNYDECMKALDRTIRNLQPGLNLPKMFHEFAVACFAKDYAMSRPERRFRFRENKPSQSFGMYPHVPVVECEPELQANFSLNAYGFVYYRFDVKPKDTALTLHVRRPGGPAPCFFTIMRMSGDRIRAMDHGAFRGKLDRTITLARRERVDGLIIMIGSRGGLANMNLWMSRPTVV